MAFLFNHTVRFHETDAAGVVYFANGLTLCHTAFEASLAAAGVDLAHFFGRGNVGLPHRPCQY
jgi:1,4-dihydroxy-2-naphthoyl-CoA hydrolase